MVFLKPLLGVISTRAVAPGVNLAFLARISVMVIVPDSFSL
jgi:hypothetical protein